MQGFTASLRLQLATAREIAKEFNHDYVAPEHILLALVRAIDGTSAAVLAKFQVAPSAVEREVVQRVKRGQGPTEAAALPFTSRAKKVIELSMLEAQNLRHSYVGSEHLLLAIIAEGKSHAAEALIDLGVTLDKARVEMLRALGQAEVVTVDTEWPT